MYISIAQLNRAAVFETVQCVGLSPTRDTIFLTSFKVKRVAVNYRNRGRYLGEEQLGLKLT